MTIPDSWEDLIVSERQDMAQCFNVAVLDVGAGTKGLTSALKRDFPTNCLSPVVVPTDVGRRAPPAFLVSDYTQGLTARALTDVGNHEVNSCCHKLKECNCTQAYTEDNFLRPRQWLALADESLYYLDNEDLCRFAPGDRLIARFHAPEDSCEKKGFFTEHKVVDGVTISRTGHKDKPWLDYYHVAGKEFLAGVVIDEASGLYMYPTILSVKGNQITAVFHFFTQRLSWGELDAKKIPSYGEAKRMWMGGPAVTRATSGTLKEPPPREPTPVEVISVILGVAPKPLAESLNTTKAAGTSTPVVTPPIPTAPVTNPTLPGVVKPVVLAVEEEERNYVKTRLTQCGLKTGTTELLTVAGAVQRRFPKLSSDRLAIIVGEELAKIRQSQLFLAKVATEEQNAVSVIAGNGVSDGDRFLKSINPFPGGFGNGKFFRAKWNRNVALPTKDRSQRVELADKVLPPGRDIIKA